MKKENLLELNTKNLIFLCTHWLDLVYDQFLIRKLKNVSAAIEQRSYNIKRFLWQKLKVRIGEKKFLPVKDKPANWILCIFGEFVLNSDI